jgi:WD40 repeat protein
MPETPQFDKAELLWSIPWDDDWVTAISFLGPTRKLAAGNQQGQILLWDLPETPSPTLPLPVRKLDGHTNSVTRLVATADGRWLISASYDHSIRYWDMNAEPGDKVKIELNAHARAAAKKESRKPVEPVEAEVVVQKAAKTLESHRDWINGLALSPDDRTLVSGDDDCQVVVWERETGKEIRRWTTKGWVYALALAPDSKSVLITERVPRVFDRGRQAAVKLWNPATGEVIRDLSELFAKEQMSAASFSPDGKSLAIGRGGEVDGPGIKVTLVDPETGKKLRDLPPGHTYGVTDVVFHPDGKHLASAGRDTMVRIWQASDGKLVKELGKPRGGQFKDWIHSIAFSADGRRLAAADMAGLVHVWAFPG